jgi:hypothetical protein
MESCEAAERRLRLKLRRAICAVFVAAIAAGFDTSAARGAPRSCESKSRQPLSEAWWTGPMLAPNASTLPRGHFLVEPYFYDVITQGRFDQNGAERNTTHENGFGSLSYVNYGLFDKFTIGMIPTFGYNEVTHEPSSSSVGFGDLTAQAQYRLTQFHECSRVPTMSINVQETFPTGKYDRLASPANGLGQGAYTTTVALYMQTYFWMPTGRILRARLVIDESFSRAAKVDDLSVYGTAFGFRGHAYPGSVFFIDAAGEYSLTRNWVLALDATYRYQNNTRVAGFNILDGGSENPPPIVQNSGSIFAVGLAPAIEYNLTRNVGILVGTRIIAAGRHTLMTVSPAVAINVFH